MKAFLLSLILPLFLVLPASVPVYAGTTINDVTQLNPIEVNQVLSPHSIEEMQQALKNQQGPVSIGGGRYSMGGQTASENSLFLDMRGFDKVIAFSPEQKLITVQPGITWRKIQELIDPYNLSVKIMQSYANFTVGGSLSVNSHGRYVGLGPLIKSALSIKVLLADGSVIEASPAQNSEIFYGAIGGYGGLGVIVEATLQLAENKKVERQVQRLRVNQYKNFFFQYIRNDSRAIFHNADFYPPAYQELSSITWIETEKALTVSDCLIPLHSEDWAGPLFAEFLSEFPMGKEIRAQILDPISYSFERVVWRNYEASYDVNGLEPKSRQESTYVLQEYFVPVERFDDFVPKMREIFQTHSVNVLNVSIRHAHPDPGSLLAWAREEVFSFVVYYKQGTSEKDKTEVGNWTRELIDAALSVGGAFYLPYQIHASEKQFHQAYPRASEFFSLKDKLDPQARFTNKLWDRYYKPWRATHEKLQSMEGYLRSEEQSFLTLPEWYIVFSYDEYAAFLKNHSASDFPYFKSIAEFWNIYWNIYHTTKSLYPVNWEYHVMNAIIGTSYSAEYFVKGVYEDTIGRFTQWLSSGKPTEEDLFIQKTFQEYADFTHLRPWYEFPFARKLIEFWSDTSLWGENAFRKWERKLAFSHEYVVKSLYGWLLGLASHGAYGPDENSIYLWLRVPSQNFTFTNPRVELVEKWGEDSQLVKIPRYEAFREPLISLSKQGVEFVEIAGNDDILITAIVPRNWTQDISHAQILFESSLAAYPSLKRIALKVPVKYLSQVLPSLEQAPVSLEHIYDY